MINTTFLHETIVKLGSGELRQSCTIFIDR